jgi:hypothetical protein
MNLLKERFLRGEVTEDTYKELKKEIEDSLNADITSGEENVGEQTINNEKQPELIEEPIKKEALESNTKSIDESDKQ